MPMLLICTARRDGARWRKLSRKVGQVPENHYVSKVLPYFWRGDAEIRLRFARPTDDAATNAAIHPVAHAQCALVENIVDV